jgi:hypothetical protein
VLIDVRLQDWFFDMIIGFLRSPRWKAPVMSFLDEHCIVFDNEEENKLEFTKIHMVSAFIANRPANKTSCF